MLVRKLTIAGFRNLHPGQWEPASGVNILYGDNAQGKTNLLEACWLFTGARSFRGAKDSEMVPFGGEEAGLTLDFFAAGREQQAAMTIRQRRQVTLNGVKLPSASRLAGILCGVVFSPAHLSLVRDGPEERRRFVDGAYCQLMPGYVGKLTDFQRVLVQRNALLRQMTELGRDTPADRDMLELWNHTMAAAGARVTVARSLYCEKLQPLAAEIYSGLSGGREQLKLLWQSPAYEAGMSPPEVAARWMELLRQAEKSDRRAGFSTEGPHREDLDLTLDGASVRIFGSQGQQRSAVLALKMAEAALLQEVTEEPPVAFLDDVMSELDVSRQEYILNHIHGWQVFITGCEPSAALRMTAGKVFHIKQGVISQ